MGESFRRDCGYLHHSGHPDRNHRAVCRYAERPFRRGGLSEPNRGPGDTSGNAARPAYALTESASGAYTHSALPAGTYCVYIYINGTYINRQFPHAQGGTLDVNYYTVRFDANGGENAPQSQIVLDGDCASEPTGATLARHALEGWYSGGQKWDFASPVTQALTLKANWTAIVPATYTLTVVNGTGSGNYAAGTEAAIRSNSAPADMRFRDWRVEPAAAFAG